MTQRQPRRWRASVQCSMAYRWRCAEHDLRPRSGDGAARRDHPENRHSDLLLRPAQPLAARQQRKHQRSDRQYLPKGTNLSGHSQEELDAIALQLNMRPRTRFDFKCPIKMMSEVMQKARAMRHDAPTSIQ